VRGTSAPSGGGTAWHSDTLGVRSGLSPPAVQPNAPGGNLGGVLRSGYDGAGGRR
jgi:hypothetical protein